MSSLYLIPSNLHPGTAADWIGRQARDALARLRHFVVEHPRTARAFLKELDLPLQALEFRVLDEHTGPDGLSELLRLVETRDVGLLSEAGCPTIADPGANLVREAHRRGVRIVPLVGPSAIPMALMASGLDGQRFAFSGYLPQRGAEREQAIRALEQRSRRERQTEIFIEAPYRNDQVLASLLAACDPGTRLCIATDLMAPTQEIATARWFAWRQVRTTLACRPSVFLLLAARSAHGRQ